MKMTDLKPKILWAFFDEICRIPHTTFNLDQMNHHLINQFTKLGYEPILDKHGNIYVKKPAYKGYEKTPTVCIQGHSDMVGDKHVDSPHDFLKDPIQPIVENGWVHANNTTLGADNGIGVAMILAIFADKTLKHGPLEALITANEEKGFKGILNFDLSKLKAKYLINADNEDDEQICIGCPGYAYISTKLPFERESKKQSGTTNLRVELSGGLGGHSGQTIHEKRINAIKEIFYMLSFVLLKHDIKLIDVEKSGVADNVVPYSCATNINVLKKDVKSISEIIHNEFRLLKEEYDLEKSIQLKITTSKTAMRPMTDDDTKKIIGLFSIAPNNVVTFNWKYSVTETSSNLGMIETKKNEIIANFMARSPYDQALKRFINRIIVLFKMFGGTSQINGFTSGWLPKSNPLADAYAKYYKKAFKKDAKQVLIAGTVECAYILSKCPNMLGISIGPLMYDVHSKNERLNIDSTIKVFDTLVGFLPTIK